MRHLFAVVFAGIAVVALLLGAVSPAASEAASLRLRRYYLNSRDTLEVVCPRDEHPVTQDTFNPRTIMIRCEDGAPPPPTPSPTPDHEHTATAEPSATPGDPPTATPTLGPDDIRGDAPADVLGTCPAAVHDRYVVRGPDGFLYRTWHPVEVPLDPANPGAGTCRFAHEHGQDPSTSLADSSPPAFGYVSAAGGLAIEAHPGFKVFVANAGTRNDEGRVSNHSSRIVAHMGTGGVMRYHMQFHSLEVDMLAGDGSGRYLHVEGMADTKNAGNICQRANPGNRIGRTVVTVPAAGCSIQSLYEIWEFKLSLRDRATVVVSTAVFDPITVMDPSDLTRVVYTHEAYPQFGSSPKHGCDAEAYHGPYMWYNAGGSTTFTTDIYGGAGSTLTQEVSAHSVVNYNATNDGTQFKLHDSQCVPGLGLKN
jgi:hypothetical protein